MLNDKQPTATSGPDRRGNQLPRKTAVLYLRTPATHHRADEELGRQRQACRKLANELSANIVAEYVDTGMSGNQLSRPGLTRLLDAVSLSGIDCVISADPTRLSPSLRHYYAVVRFLDRHGVSRAFVTAEKPANSPTAGLIQAVLKLIARESARNVNPTPAAGGKSSDIDDAQTQALGRI